VPPREQPDATPDIDERGRSKPAVPEWKPGDVAWTCASAHGGWASPRNGTLDVVASDGVIFIAQGEHPMSLKLSSIHRTESEAWETYVHHLRSVSEAAIEAYIQARGAQRKSLGKEPKP
jgi:hypothetical protein